jgi:hypothetical protein
MVLFLPPPTALCDGRYSRLRYKAAAGSAHDGSDRAMANNREASRPRQRTSQAGLGRLGGQHVDENRGAGSADRPQMLGELRGFTPD